jgi:hypothetical protein
VVGASGPSSPQEREEAARTWLGGAARGGERLARIFQVDQSARASELAAELADLRTRLGTLERELSTLDHDSHSSDATPQPASKSPMVDLPRVVPSERDFRLRRCERFAVYAGARPLGVIDGIRYESRTDRPDVLEVRSGRLGHRLLLVPVGDVEAIDPDEEVVIVSEACWSPGIRERLRDYLEQVPPPVARVLSWARTRRASMPDL